MKKTGSLDVTVIIAARNEEKGLGPTLRELREVLDDPFYLVVDGGSVDGTVKIAEEMGAGVMMQDGRGKGQAVGQALAHTNPGTRYVVLIDADHTYPAKYIPKMIEILENSPEVGMVVGNRFGRHLDLKALGNPYYLGNRLLAFLQYVLNGVKLRDPLTGLRVVRWEILNGWKPKASSFDIEVELNHHVEKKGYRIEEIFIHYRERLGEKKLKLMHGFVILWRIFVQILPHH